MVAYSTEDLDPESALPVVEGNLSPIQERGEEIPTPSLAETHVPAALQEPHPPAPEVPDDFLTVAGQDVSAQDGAFYAPPAPRRATRLADFSETSDPRDWRDSWNDPPPPGKAAAADMEIDDVLRNSDKMVGTVKRMYQSARSKYDEYRHLSSAAAQAYARIAKAIKKAQMGGYVLGIKSPFPLPPDWQAASDPDNRIYYINSKVPPPPPSPLLPPH
jgi:hypothetical protein